MITLTDNAAAQIRKLHSEKNAGESQYLRILVREGGCSGFEYGMDFDEKKEGDHLLESNGVKFLVDEISLDYMPDSTIDFDGGLSGRGFEIDNPKKQNSCGCGKSFN